jgi:hypothetical protein
MIDLLPVFDRVNINVRISLSASERGLGRGGLSRQYPVG